jgi:hypothetical protein
MTDKRTTRRATILNVAVALIALALLVGGPAHADALQPPVLLGPITVANGTAVVNGSVGSDAAAAKLSVNGQPVGINTDGAFSALVNLGGQSALTLTLTNPATGDRTTTTIPVTTDLVGSGTVPADALNALQQAAVSIAKPAGGFVSVDGKPVQVHGSVLDKDALASLSVNGKDVLDQVKPDGAFAETIPGSSERLVVTATDTKGNSQTSTYTVSQSSSGQSSNVTTASVAAAGAKGVRVAAVRYATRTARAHRTMTMTVTVRDRAGLLVRDAVVRIRVANFQVRRHFVRGGQQSKKSSAKGVASFVVRLNKNALGKRVFMFALAKTPSATANRTTSVLLPRAARPRR